MAALKTVWILADQWASDQPADLDLHCFLNRIYLTSA